MKRLRSFSADLALLPAILRQAASTERHRRASDAKLAAWEASGGPAAAEARMREDAIRFGFRSLRTGRPLTAEDAL